VEKDDILGDGVNVAARLEGIADPGGFCISEDAFRQVRGKLVVPSDLPWRSPEDPVGPAPGDGRGDMSQTRRFDSHLNAGAMSVCTKSLPLNSSGSPVARARA
jgi:class 3 adenylate cyclase